MGREEEVRAMGFVSWLNRRVAPLITSLGITARSVTLEVRGRTSGEPIRLSMSHSELDGRQYLVSLAGERAWVKNVRAAGGEAWIVHGGRLPGLRHRGCRRIGPAAGEESLGGRVLPGSDSLLGIAEFALALAGFSAVVLVLARRGGEIFGSLLPGRRR